jgi:succinate-semialdehyde dehydrogenase / glutarate-semialdehyde dehydrogenase
MNALRSSHPATAPDVAPLLETLARQVQAADPSRHRDITNAMTGEPLGRVPHCTAADVVVAAERARVVQPE